jgi:putative DNA primase/helicase
VTDDASTPRDIRLRLREAGYSPIPVNGKEPVFKGWQRKLDATADEIASWDTKYPSARNTGILARDTAAIDIDLLHYPEAADAVEEMVRERFGSRGKILVRFGQRPKRLIPLRADALFKKKKVVFVDVKTPPGDKAKPPAIEILGDGQQFVADGIHPDTEQPYDWRNGSLIEVKRHELAHITESEAEAFKTDVTRMLVTRFGLIPVDASRETRAAAAVAAAAAATGAAGAAVVAEPEKVAAALAVVPNTDLHWDDWNAIGMATWRGTNGSDAGRAAFDAFSQKSTKYHEDAVVERWAHYPTSPPTSINAATIYWLADKADPGWRKRLRRGEAVEPTSASGRPIMKVAPGSLSATADEAEQNLIDADVQFYERSNKLARPIIRIVDTFHGRKTTVAQLARIDSVYMRDVLGRVADWYKLDMRSRRWLPTDPPPDVANTILARAGEWGFPTIGGIITTPTMRPDGTILDQPGYDPATRLLLVNPPPMSSIPEKPTRDDAVAALALLDGLLVEFPLIDGVAKSVALSILITPVVRGAFSVAPMHVTDAPEAGAGKSYLLDIAAAIATGQPMPVIAAGRSEEETEKRLGSALLASQPLVTIDNVNGELRGDALCQIIERPRPQVRILGRSSGDAGR